jgi:hypothetical protein
VNLVRPGSETNAVANKTPPLSQSSSNVEPPADHDDSQSNANYHILNFTHSLPANSDDFFAPGKKHRIPAELAPPVWRIRSIPPARTPHPPPPPPPAPPTRDLAAFQRILATTTPKVISAAVLAAYTALPTAQELFWEHLGNTATVDGSIYLVARCQVPGSSSPGCGPRLNCIAQIHSACTSGTAAARGFLPASLGAL